MNALAGSIHDLSVSWPAASASTLGVAVALRLLTSATVANVPATDAAGMTLLLLATSRPTAPLSSGVPDEKS